MADLQHRPPGDQEGDRAGLAQEAHDLLDGPTRVLGEVFVAQAQVPAVHAPPEQLADGIPAHPAVRAVQRPVPLHPAAGATGRLLVAAPRVGHGARVPYQVEDVQIDAGQGGGDVRERGLLAGVDQHPGIGPGSYGLVQPLGDVSEQRGRRRRRSPVLGQPDGGQVPGAQVLTLHAEHGGGVGHPAGVEAALEHRCPERASGKGLAAAAEALGYPVGAPQVGQLADRGVPLELAQEVAEQGGAAAPPSGYVQDLRTWDRRAGRPVVVERAHPV